MIRVSGQAEMVVLFGRLHVGGPSEEFCLLVVRRSEVVETVRIARLFGKSLLERVDGTEVVALLVELDALRIVGLRHAPTAGACGHHKPGHGRDDAAGARRTRNDGGGMSHDETP